MMRILHRVAREPLVHFMLLGAAIFVLHGRSGDAGERHVEIGRADFEHLRAGALAQWGREPSASQLDTLVDEFVREEILVREARAAGIDRDDVVVRRRLAQKMDFIAQQGVLAPDDAELRAFHAAHPDRYAVPGTVSFTQRYFGEDAGAARAALQALRSGREVRSRRFMLGATLAAQTGTFVERDFGAEFARAIAALPVGVWSGPLASAHGLHLVRIDALDTPRTATFDEVRDRVSADLANERLASARQAAYARLRERYTVRVARDDARTARARP